MLHESKSSYFIAGQEATYLESELPLNDIQSGPFMFYICF